MKSLPYLGIPTFLGWEADAPAPDTVALGVPYDEGTPYRAGARFGPRALREASMRLRFASDDGLNFFDVESRADICVGQAAVDAGDTRIYPLDQERTFAEITDQVEAICAHGGLPVILGGDNSVTYPVVRGIRVPGMWLIQFDAHLDYADSYFTVEHANATPMRRLFQQGYVERIFHIGIRGLDNAREVLRATEADGNVVLTARECRDGTAADALMQIPEGTPVFVSIDIDVADPSIAPGTGYHEPGGLDHDVFRTLVDSLAARARLVGCEVVEVSPSSDPAGITALLAVHWLIEVLGKVPRWAAADRPGLPDAHASTI